MSADLDLSAPLRAALVGATTITTLLPAYLGSFPIFTRRPVPIDAPYPLIIVSPDITVIEQDGITDRQPIVTRDISVYGRNDTPDHYRTVELIAYAVRTLFHRNGGVITVTDYSVTEIRATGPRRAPVDDEQTVGRLVELTIQLAQIGV